MKSNLRLGHASLDGIREIGGFGQPLHALYPQIRAVLSFEFGPDAAYLLAEPVVDRSKNRIDWYAEGEPDEKPIPLADLPEEERQAIVASVEEFLNRGRQLADRYSTSEDTHRAQIGAILKAVFAKSTETEIFIINGKPVMTGWGFSTDAPWNLSPNAEQQLTIEHIAKSEAATVSDSVTPEVPVIENKSPASLQAPSAEIGQESELPPVVISTLDGGQPQAVDEASAVASGSPPPVTQSQPVRPRERGNSGDKQVLASSPAVASGSLFHYIVVGSRYFWGVVVLSLLALLLAVAWGFIKERIIPSDTPAIPTTMTDPKFDERLSQLQQEETQLRGQLEKLLVRLASQRGQCQLQSDVGSPLPKLPAPDQAQTEMTPSSLASGVSKPSSDPVPANTTILAQTETGARVLPVPSTQNSESVASTPPNTDAQAPQAPPLASDAIRAANETTSVKPLTPVPSSSSLTPSAVLKPSSIPQTTPDVSTPKDSALPGSKWRETSPGQSLEETLTGRESSASAPIQDQTLVEPPVKAELTAEERREFANRMSATGATSGEITATLLWNGHGDLDLVVRCPSGHQLDFRNTNKCGGTLDVDANASRDRLQERPVENAFWPAGKADPGVYEVGVRYVPRKDEDTPLETPFQVRLSRGGQETVFKGTVRPNAVVPVTTFTVKR